ncbi:MAG: galactokinase [Planctomycetota bacterium]
MAEHNDLMLAPEGTENRSLIDSLVGEFRRRFDQDPRVFFAPGRVNLIGAHLDYNGGSVLPAPIARGTYVAVARTVDRRMRLASMDLPRTLDFPLSDVPSVEDLGWAAYPVGVWRLGNGAEPADICVAGDLPRGAGLSSSASLEVAAGLAFSTLFGWSLDARQLAELAWRAENEFVGVKCGIMDQFASSLAREGHALYLDCHDRSHRHVQVSGEIELLVLNTGKPRQLVGSEFNERVEQCRSALGTLRRSSPGKTCLASFQPSEVEAARGQLDDIAYRRARHVASESLRVSKAMAALEDGDYETLGRQLLESHRSAAEDYEVSCPELDFLVEKICAQRGVYGARLTGAGFGGCVVALQRPGSVGKEEERSLRRGFSQRFGYEPVLMRLRIGGGPREVRIES